MKILILIISVSLFFLLYKLYTTVYGRPRIFTVSFYFCIWYTIDGAIGASLLNVIQFDYEKSLGMYNRPDLLFKIWLFTVAGFFMLICGMLLSHTVFDKACQFKSIQHSMLQKPLVYTPKNGYLYYVLCAIYVVCFFVLMLYRNKLGGKFPIEYIFSGLSQETLNILRSDATNNFSGKYYRYAIFMRDVPFICCILLMFLKEKGRKWRILFFIFLLHSMFFGLLAFEKAPVFLVLLAVLLVYIFKVARLDIKTILYIVLFFSGSIVIVYRFFMGQYDMSFMDLFLGAIHRLFVGQIAPFFWYLKYAEDFGFLYGLSLPNPGGVLPFEHFNLTVEMMNYALGDLGEVVGTYPTIFLGEIYINFGVWCMFLGALFLGFFLGTIDIIFISLLNKNKNVFFATIYVFLMNYCTKFTSTGYLGIIVDLQLWLNLILIMMLYYFSNVKRTAEKCIKSVM